jgi:hypothetical protein
MLGKKAPQFCCFRYSILTVVYSLRIKSICSLSVQEISGLDSDLVSGAVANASPCSRGGCRATQVVLGASHGLLLDAWLLLVGQSCANFRRERSVGHFRSEGQQAVGRAARESRRSSEQRLSRVTQSYSFSRHSRPAEQQPGKNSRHSRDSRHSRHSRQKTQQTKDTADTVDTSEYNRYFQCVCIK